MKLRHRWTPLPPDGGPPATVVSRQRCRWPDPIRQICLTSSWSEERGEFGADWRARREDRFVRLPRRAAGLTALVQAQIRGHAANVGTEAGTGRGLEDAALNAGRLGEI